VNTIDALMRDMDSDGQDWPNPPGWRPEDDWAAHEEGWGIFECDGSTDDAWQVQADSDSGKLASDGDAWNVLSIDTPLHRRAVAWLHFHAPMELGTIRGWQRAEQAIGKRIDAS
jgi:hypothetical protein